MAETRTPKATAAEPKATADRTKSEAAPTSPKPAVSARSTVEDPNFVASTSGLMSQTGEGHDSLVDDEGKPIDFESALDAGDGTQTFVTVTKRINERFTTPGSVRTQSRLLYPAGARLTREQAEEMKGAVKRAEASKPADDADAAKGRLAQDRGEGMS